MLTHSSAVSGNSFLRSTLASSLCKSGTMNSSSPSLDTFILASPRQLFSGSNLSRYHSSDLSTVKTEWKGENSPRFIKHHPQFLHDLFPCSEMLDASSGPVSFFSYLASGDFPNLQSCSLQEQLGGVSPPPAPLFFFFQKENWNLFRLPPHPPPFSPSFRSVAAQVWKPVKHKRLEYIK